jgi:RHS repeat-associated protein
MEANLSYLDAYTAPTQKGYLPIARFRDWQGIVHHIQCRLRAPKKSSPAARRGQRCQAALRNTLAYITPTTARNTSVDCFISLRRWSCRRHLAPTSCSLRSCLSITINYPGSGNFTSFTYDGMGNRVKIVESGTVSSTKQFIFAQGGMCEVRDSGGTNVLNQFFNYGEVISGSGYFFTYDHLGSVRDLASLSGNFQAEYAYDCFGRVTKVSEAIASDFQFAGYYNHSRSGLCLTVNRAYNSSLGRWLSRDPAEENGGLNLYAYVGNSPLMYSDPSGLAYGKEHCEGIANRIMKTLSTVNFYNQKLATHEQIVEDWAGDFQNRINEQTGNLYKGGSHTQQLDSAAGRVDKMFSDYEANCNCYNFLSDKKKDQIKRALEIAANELSASYEWAFYHDKPLWWSPQYVIPLGQPIPPNSNRPLYGWPWDWGK